MDSLFIQWLIGQTGIGGLAAFSLFLLNKSYQDGLRRERESAQEHREDKRVLISVLSETSKALATLESAIATRRSEKDEN